MIPLRVAEVPIEPLSPSLPSSFESSNCFIFGSLTYFDIQVISSFNDAFVYLEGGFVSFSAISVSVIFPE